METELAYKAEKGFQSRLSYALQTTEDRMTGGTLSNSPRHLARWQNTLPLYLDKVFLSTELAFTSAVQTTPATASRVGEYWLLNSTLYTRELARGWSASVSVYNLLDRRYGHPVGDEIRFGQILQDGRSFQFKLSVRF